MLNSFRWFILIFFLSLGGVGVVFNELNIILISICGIVVHNIIYCIQKFNQRIVFLAFNITFFTFLVGRMVVKSLGNYQDIYNSNIYGLDFNDSNIIRHIFKCLLISLVFLFLGYSIDQNKKNRERVKITTKLFRLKEFEDRNNQLMALVSCCVFYITYIFNVLILLDKARFSSNIGYTELYANYSSSFPSFFIKIAEMCNLALFIYLSTRPTKKKCYIPLGLYFSLGCLSLIVGQRNNFVLNIMIILVYLCLRNYTDKTQKWFGKKEMLVCIISFPIMIIILNAVAYYRMGDAQENTSIMYIINEFFYSQGVSANLIGYAKTLGYKLDPNKIYTFGRLIDFMNNNIITQLITDIPKYNAQTLESALYGNSFADSMSYILSPGRYLSGWGYGSCYIAEMYKDFGYMGIAIGNYIVGVILSITPKMFSKGVIVGGISLSMIRLLLYIGRDTTTSFIVSTFSLINVLTIVVIIMGVYILKNIKKNK